MKIGDIIKKESVAKFLFYRDGSLWYRIEQFEFPVPIEDTGSAIFLSEDKAIFFMRWVRKHLDFLLEARENQSSY